MLDATAKAMEPDPREAKLPIWVQETLRKLRQEVTWLTSEAEAIQARLDAASGVTGPEGTDTIMDPDEDAPLRLRMGTTVRFLAHTDGKPDDRRAVDARVTVDGRIEVDAPHCPLSIRPKATNVIHLIPIK